MRIEDSYRRIFYKTKYFVASNISETGILGEAYFSCKVRKYGAQRIIYVKQNTKSIANWKGNLLTTEIASENGSKGWKKLLRKHWNMLVLFVVAGISVVIGAIYVFLWYVGDAQSTGMVPSILGLWTMGDIVAFSLHLLLWELLLVGIPVALIAAVGWLWWKKLPGEERKEYHFSNTPSRSTGGGGAISLLFSIAFGIKVFIDGNWDVPISTWNLDYVVNSLISIIVWGAIIFGIPAAVIGLIFLAREMKKRPDALPEREKTLSEEEDK